MFVQSVPRLRCLVGSEVLGAACLVTLPLEPLLNHRASKGAHRPALKNFRRFLYTN